MDMKKVKKMGIEEGRKEGKEQGIQQEKIRNAKMMLQLDISIEKIIKITGLTREEIEQIEK